MKYIETFNAIYAIYRSSTLDISKFDIRYIDLGMMYRSSIYRNVRYFYISKHSTRYRYFHLLKSSIRYTKIRYFNIPKCSKRYIEIRYFDTSKCSIRYIKIRYFYTSKCAILYASKYRNSIFPYMETCNTTSNANTPGGVFFNPVFDDTVAMAKVYALPHVPEQLLVRLEGAATRRNTTQEQRREAGQNG